MATAVVQQYLALACATSPLEASID